MVLSRAGQFYFNVFIKVGRKLDAMTVKFIIQTEDWMTKEDIYCPANMVLSRAGHFYYDISIRVGQVSKYKNIKGDCIFQAKDWKVM